MSFTIAPISTMRNTSIRVHGDRNEGGEFVTYTIHDKKNPAEDGEVGLLCFQDGPVKEKGVNGVTIEDLLEICIHRLICFQTGPYACSCNEQAADFIKMALGRLDSRTAERMKRNVEGTMQA